MYDPKELYEITIKKLPDYMDSTDVSMLIEEIVFDVVLKINEQFSDRSFTGSVNIKIKKIDKK